MERVVTPRDDRSVISTFHAPSRAARRRWREANVMSDSCASVAGAAESGAALDIPAGAPPFSSSIIIICVTLAR